MLVATAVSRLIPWLLKLALDALGAGSDTREMTWLVVGMILAAAVSGAFVYLERWLVRSAARKVEHDLRRDLYSHVLGLDLAFFGQKKTGDLMARFTNDINALRVVAGPGIMYAASTAAMLLVSIAAMIAIDPFLTLVAFAPYPLVSAATFFFGRAIRRRSRVVQDLFGSMSSRVREDLAGVRVVRAYGQEESLRRNFGELNESYLEANMDVARLRGRFMASMGTLAGSGLVIALLVGGRQVIDGALSLGSLVAFSVYLAELTWPVFAVGWVVGMLERGASAAMRLDEVLGVSPTIISGQIREQPEPRVRFEGVRFRHPGSGRDAVRDISFELAPGQTLGIVGRTGSGKSTILKLMERFYDPTEGRILLDGIDLRERRIEQIRAMTGYAPQDSVLFARTVAENIAYGHDEASRVEIEEMAARVRLRREIEELEGGFDSMVGERGVTLSGGQRQRVSLARALLSEPALLLLDSTLSSVDAETEREILQELARYTRQRTSIIASHRISAVQHADWTLVLDQGRICEQGTHHALLAKGGLYARIYEQQRLSEEIEEVE